MRSCSELKAAYISVSDFNEAPWLLRVHIIHCPNERKTPKATLIHVFISKADHYVLINGPQSQIRAQKCKLKIIRTLPLQTGE